MPSYHVPKNVEDAVETIRGFLMNKIESYDQVFVTSSTKSYHKRSAEIVANQCLNLFSDTKKCFVDEEYNPKHLQ